jgi:poly-beta-1,6-N-acetyl-D-glucosamine synthase
MEGLSFIFWISLGVLVYCFVGYGFFALTTGFFKRLFNRRKKWSPAGSLPVTLIITAYNERTVLEEKIRNIQSLDYPASLLQVIFVTDGSGDGSEELLREYPFIRLLHEPERKGKYAAIKRAMQEVSTPIVIFSDANSFMNPEAVSRMVAHYRDPQVGGVAGEKKISSTRTVLSTDPVGFHKATAVGKAEGFYWKYESFMKKLDAGLYTVVGAAGELFSIRTDLFQALEEDPILDDFIISMQVCLQGYRMAYEPRAFATEYPSASIAEEEKRKIRIAAGAYQAASYVLNKLNILDRPVLAFQYFSRRLLRWVFCPVLLVIFFISTILLAYFEHNLFYSIALYAQLFFYLLAFTGGLLVRIGKNPGIFTIPFYFVFMNYCLARGFIRYINGKQSVLWEKAIRQSSVVSRQ